MPRRRPNPDADSKPADQSPSAQPSLDEQGNPVRRKPGPKPKVDEHGNRINPPRLKTDEEVGGDPATEASVWDILSCKNEVADANAGDSNLRCPGEVMSHKEGSLAHVPCLLRQAGT